MSTQRCVAQRGNSFSTSVDVEELAKLLSAGGKLLRKSEALLSEPNQWSRRGRSEGHHGQRRTEQMEGKKQQDLADNGECRDTARMTDTEEQRNLSEGAVCLASEDGNGKLIPGIPEDVVLNHILTKTDWADVAALSFVSLSWQRVIREREVYKARLRHHCTQSFLAVVHRAPRFFKEEEPSRDLGDFVTRFYDDYVHVPPRFHLAISLYNPAANSWHLLPPIPGVNCGIPVLSATAFIAGRLYALGGEGLRNRKFTPRKSVFMIDLALGHRGEWKQCASMRFGRSDFACSVIHGKIYVAGGWSNLDNVRIEAEMFDPEKNSWQCIESMPTTRVNYSVQNLDEMLYVIGGSVLHPLYDGGNDDVIENNRAQWADVYDPRQNLWKRVDKIGGQHKAQTWVVIKDKLISFDRKSIDVYDKRSESWRKFMSNSWDVLESTGATFVSACAAADVNDEVYVYVRWLKGWPYEITLLKSKEVARGLDSAADKQASPVWNTVKCPYEFNRDFFFLVPVQL